jgi:hypothetical protein
VVGAEGLAASIAVELVAAGAEQFFASRAGVHFQDGVSVIPVAFNGKAVKERVAGGAGGGIELLSHNRIMP